MVRSGVQVQDSGEQIAASENSVIEHGGDGNLRTILLKRYPAPQFSLVVRRMPMSPI